MNTGTVSVPSLLEKLFSCRRRQASGSSVGAIGAAMRTVRVTECSACLLRSDCGVIGLKIGVNRPFLGSNTPCL